MEFTHQHNLTYVGVHQNVKTELSAEKWLIGEGLSKMIHIFGNYMIDLLSLDQEKNKRASITTPGIAVVAALAATTKKGDVGGDSKNYLLSSLSSLVVDRQREAILLDVAGGARTQRLLQCCTTKVWQNRKSNCQREHN